jgi:hypothetical protein
MVGRLYRRPFDASKVIQGLQEASIPLWLTQESISELNVKGEYLGDFAFA